MALLLPQPQRRNLNPVHSRCTGRRLCEYACVRQHYGKVVNPELSRVRVYLMYPGPIAVPILCSNCMDHPCTEACPVNPRVITYDEKKFIVRLTGSAAWGTTVGDVRKPVGSREAVLSTIIRPIMTMP